MNMSKKIILDNSMILVKMLNNLRKNIKKLMTNQN